MGQMMRDEARSLQVLRGFMNWFSFFVEMVVSILRGAPSFNQILSCIGCSTTTHHFFASSSPSFKPFPVVEIPLDELPPLAQHVTLPRSVQNREAVTEDHRLERLTVVLDLDETLICAYEKSSLPDIVRTQASQAGLKWFELECVSSDKVYEGKPKVSHVTVFERPGLREFLKKIGEFADLILFTAGLEDYARPLVDKIDVDNLLSSRLYRPSTVSTAYREHVKDLSSISKDLRRIVIVDNNPFSFLLQPSNGIPCIPFSVGQPYDDQLLEALLPLLKNLSAQKDVRPLLHETFHMPEWFQTNGVPASATTAQR